MTLTPEQKEALASWIAAGDNLSTVQKKLSEQFQVSMTYRDLRFLVDDLNLALKDAAPKADAGDVTKSSAAPTAGAAPDPRGPSAGKKGFLEKAKEKLGLAKEDSAGDADAALEDEVDDLPADDAGNVSVSVDNVTLIPGALASGSVTFGDGVTAKWIVDQYGRPGFTEVSKPGYQPTPADGRAFMQELSRALQKRGF
ncbi:MAG: hypothetical protein HY736_18920 [Verrucomicrobia bacterium]|nr:hypothetical protein [Verrucomicrobiota bacterium]